MGDSKQATELHVEDANGTVYLAKQVGWCWPHRTWQSHTMFLPFDGGPPPHMSGLHEVFTLEAERG
jgi:hypothetical protein